jgi:hypothetical protein
MLAQTEGKAMTLRQLMGGSAATIIGAGMIVASLASSQAAMLSASQVDHHRPPTRTIGVGHVGKEQSA